MDGTFAVSVPNRFKTNVSKRGSGPLFKRVGGVIKRKWRFHRHMQSAAAAGRKQASRPPLHVLCSSVGRANTLATPEDRLRARPLIKKCRRQKITKPSSAERMRARLVLCA